MKNYLRVSTNLGLEALLSIFNSIYDATEKACLAVREDSHAGVRIAVTDSSAKPASKEMGPWLYNSKEKAMDRLASECKKNGYLHITAE